MKIPVMKNTLTEFENSVNKADSRTDTLEEVVNSINRDLKRNEAE